MSKKKKKLCNKYFQTGNLLLNVILKSMSAFEINAHIKEIIASASQKTCRYSLKPTRTTFMPEPDPCMVLLFLFT